MAELSGKTALVTGASRGIGRGIARRLAADGALVVVHYGRNEVAAKETVTDIEQDGGTAFAIKADLSTGDGVDRLLEGMISGLLGEPLDILVNNAGDGSMGTGLGGSIETLQPHQFDEVFAVNVRAPFFIVQQALPLMRDGGRIVNISSVATRVAVSQQIAYSMSKGAVEVMSRSLANALGPRGITVNTVSPGATDTDVNAFLHDLPEVMSSIIATTALGRIAEPADIADVVAFLASDDARWITGSLIDASGGSYLGPVG